MSKQLFKVTEVCDTRKQGSEIADGKILLGDLSPCSTKVFYKDGADTDWIFYIGDTCELITEFPKSQNQ